MITKDMHMYIVYMYIKSHTEWYNLDQPGTISEKMITSQNTAFENLKNRFVNTQFGKCQVMFLLMVVSMCTILINHFFL